MTAIDVDFQVQGSGPPLYMVHGIGSRKTTWNKLLPHLSEDFTCVTYDLRGHGESPVPPTPYSLEDMVDDIEALRLKLDHKQIYLIGHSLGGMIGPAYANQYPDNTAAVVLLSTAAGRSMEDRGKLATVRQAMVDNGIGPVLETLINRWYTDEFIESNPAAISARKQQVIDTPSDVFLDVFRLYAETEMAPWLKLIKCPCLVLTGALDGGCNPRLNQFIADEIPNAELVILDGLKHSILIEDPDRVANPVKEFLLHQLA